MYFGRGWEESLGEKAETTWVWEEFLPPNQNVGIADTWPARGGVKIQLRVVLVLRYAGQDAQDPANSDFIFCVLRTFSLLLIYGMYSNPPCVMCISVLPTES